MNHELQLATLRPEHHGRRVVPVPAAPRGVVPQLAAAALGTGIPGRFGNYAVQADTLGPGMRTLFKQYRMWPSQSRWSVPRMSPLITLGPNYAFLHNFSHPFRPQYREYLAVLNYALGFHAIGWLDLRSAINGRVPVICTEDVTGPGLDRPRVLRVFSGALLLRARPTQYVGADIAGGITLRPGECRFGIYAEAAPAGNRFIQCRNFMRADTLVYRPRGSAQPVAGPVADEGILAGLNPDPDAPVPHDSDGEPAGDCDGDEYLGNVRECINCGYEYDHDEDSECPDCGYEP